MSVVVGMQLCGMEIFDGSKEEDKLNQQQKEYDKIWNLYWAPPAIISEIIATTRFETEKKIEVNLTKSIFQQQIEQGRKVIVEQRCNIFAGQFIQLTILSRFKVFAYLKKLSQSQPDNAMLASLKKIAIQELVWD